MNPPGIFFAVSVFLGAVVSDDAHAEGGKSFVSSGQAFVIRGEHTP